MVFVLVTAVILFVPLKIQRDNNIHKGCGCVLITEKEFNNFIINDVFPQITE